MNKIVQMETFTKHKKTELRECLEGDFMASIKKELKSDVISSDPFLELFMILSVVADIVVEKIEE